MFLKLKGFFLKKKKDRREICYLCGLVVRLMFCCALGKAVMVLLWFEIVGNWLCCWLFWFMGLGGGFDVVFFWF